MRLGLGLCGLGRFGGGSSRRFRALGRRFGGLSGSGGFSSGLCRGSRAVCRLGSRALLRPLQSGSVRLLSGRLRRGSGLSRRSRLIRGWLCRRSWTRLLCWLCRRTIRRPLYRWTIRLLRRRLRLLLGLGKKPKTSPPAQQDEYASHILQIYTESPNLPLIGGMAPEKKSSPLRVPPRTSPGFLGKGRVRRACPKPHAGCYMGSSDRRGHKVRERPSRTFLCIRVSRWGFPERGAGGREGEPYGRELDSRSRTARLTRVSLRLLGDRGGRTLKRTPTTRRNRFLLKCARPSQIPVLEPVRAG